MYLASWLRTLPVELEIKIIDARIKGLSLEQTGRSIADFSPQYVGISCMHADSDEAHALASVSKQLDSRPIVIIGGPYASAVPETALSDPAIDFCVKGEGEEAFGELILALESGSPALSIKGIFSRVEGKVCYGGDREPVADLDRLPFPAWDLIDLEGYFNNRKRALENPVQIYRRGVSLISSRGCPFQCIFCHDIFGKRFRGRSPENLLAEIKLLTGRYGVREIEFLDDTFNFDSQRAKRICDLIRQEAPGIKICFSNGMRADLIDDEMLAKFREAGVYRINYGIESVSPRIQKIMKKNLDPARAQEAIRKTVKSGMLCGGFFMLGFPGETEAEMMQTVEFARRSELHTAVFAIVTPYPGTEMYAMAPGAKGNVSFSTVGKISYNLSCVSNKRLEEITRLAYRKFYLSLGRLIRIYLKAARKRALFGNFL
ncbi:MAG: radical SAM protein, partial [Candidatus Omnitrophica bacterium]|nr:radical SAM protein [Candidatus Omnitrophota bacterium]